MVEEKRRGRRLPPGTQKLALEDEACFAHYVRAQFACMLLFFINLRELSYWTGFSS